jgi:hypothetical protein
LEVMCCYALVVVQDGDFDGGAWDRRHGGRVMLE